MLLIRFGVAESRAYPAPGGGLAVEVASPALPGPGEERHPVPASTVTRRGDWLLCDDGGEALCAAAVAEVDDDDLEAVTGRLYDALFAMTKGLHLYRVWHHVPAINVAPPGREENYRRFCRARAAAFERAFPDDPERRMPAASAVGVDGSRLVVVAVAGRVPPEHFENPEQTPAYRYPEKYGPKPPSFARATRVRFSDTTWGFISGTASIKGSDTLHPGDFAAQAAVTEGNLRLMRAALGVVAPATTRRAYVRRASDASAAGGPALRADICREDLLLEIEESFVSPH